MEPTRTAKEGKAEARGKGMARGGEQRVEKEAMKRPRDKKKEGEGRRGRRNDGREIVEKGEETKRGREKERG